MKKINNITSSILIRNMESNDKLFPVFNSIYQDIKNIWSVLYEQNKLFLNTNNNDNLISNGIDGYTIYANKNSTDGFFYNSQNNKPKTISEVLLELYINMNSNINDNNIGTEISNIKNIIGLEKFINGATSSPDSLIYLIKIINKNLKQIITDVFNRNGKIGDEIDPSTYAFNGLGTQTQQYSIKDLLSKLINIHGKESELNHNNLVNRQSWNITLSDNNTINFNNKKYSTFFLNKEDIFSNDQNEFIFFNPYNNNIKIVGLSINIKVNTLNKNSSITVYKNNQPTLLNIDISNNYTGQIKKTIDDLFLEPNDYINFEINTKLCNIGHILINNISLIIETKDN